jgi:hypothetical protein
MPRNASRVIGGSLFGFLILLVFSAFLFGPRTIYCGNSTVLVTARLLDARSGEPVPGAAVMAFGSREAALDPEQVDLWRRFAAEHAEAEAEALASGERLYMASPCPSGTTAADGTLRLFLGVWFCESSGGVAGCRLRKKRERGRGAEVLRIERPDRPPVVIDLPPGVWHEGGGAPTCDHAWELGDLRVP